MGYDYQKRDAGDVKQSAEANDSKWHGYIKAGIPIFKMTQDVHRLRFMYPTYAGRRKAIGYRVTTHPNVGPEEKTYLCLRAMKDQPDPVDERLSDARRAGDGDEKWAKAMKPVDRLLTYVVDMDDMDTGVQLWPMHEKANSALDRASIDSKGAVIEIEHPEFGRVVEVEAKEKHSRGKEKFSWTECEFVVSERESWISEDEDQQKEWEDFIAANPLDKVFVFETYDDLLEALGEVQHGRGSRDDDQPRGRSARRGRATGGERRTREAPQEDVGPDADPRMPWADSEPEVEAPTQSRRRTRGQPAPEARERDLEREVSGRGLPETEEPERPARGRRRAAEPEQEAPPRRRRTQEPEPEQDAPPRRRRTQQPESESESEQPRDEELAPRRRRRPTTQDEPQADPPPARRRQRSAP